MIRSLMRSLVAIVVSLAVAMALVIVVEVVTNKFHPYPPGTDTSDHELVAAHVAKFPHWVLAVAAVGWAGLTFVSTWIATRLGAGRHIAHGIGVGAFLLLAAAFNIYLLPYPVWFDVANCLLLPLATFAGVKLGRGLNAQAKSDIQLSSAQ